MKKREVECLEKEEKMMSIMRQDGEESLERSRRLGSEITLIKEELSVARSEIKTGRTQLEE